MRRRIATADAMARLGGRLARAAGSGGAIIFLQGELGAGKTTLVRGFLAALGHEGAVRSPTYTLVEGYAPAGRIVNHLDLYRLATPEALEDIGIRDLLDPDALMLIEWPEMGEGMLPPADVTVRLEIAADGARTAGLDATTSRGAELLGHLRNGEEGGA